MTPENTIREGSRTRCRECRNAAVRARYARRKQEGGPNPFREKVARYRRSLKSQVMDAYGNRCACCGETQPLFLTVDHVENDGAEHRAGLGHGQGGDRIYKWLIREGFPSGFQILCWNCNVGKHLNGGVCPHQDQ